MGLATAGLRGLLSFTEDEHLPANAEEIKEAMQLVKNIARHMHGTNFAVRQLGDVDDVAAWGACGMLRAAKRFDPSRRCKFATFATPSIRGAIIDAVRETGTIIKTPRLAVQRGQGSHLVRSLEAIRAMYESDTFKDTGWEPASELPKRNDLPAAIESFLLTLSRRERSIVRLYFGLVGGHYLTMKQVGALHGMSESRVSQLMSDILKRAYKHRGIRELERRRRP